MLFFENPIKKGFSCLNRECMKNNRDLWVDNLLIKKNHLSAILDFDRMKYDYPALDVARAEISGCLDDDQLQIKPAIAYLEGYQKHREVPEGFLTHSLQWLWMMESTWWIHEKMDEEIGPPIRFAKEMIWLGEHFEKLELELDNL